MRFKSMRFKSMSHEAHEARHRERTQLGLTFLRLSATLRGRQLGHKLREAFRMKLIIALAALVSSLIAIIPADAQVQRKDPACIEKCHRAGGGRGIVPTCIAACPALKLGPEDLKKQAASNNPNDPNWVNRSGRGGNCRRYATVNNCQVRYDTRDYQCKCI
jgi:hypothetical protein